MPAPPRTPAQQTVAQMYLPEGFRAELVMAEPDLHQPVAFTFDERGRIWVAEAHSYPTKRPAGQGLDRIVIFEDGEGDGKFETRKVFAKGLNLV
jgi:glucose/arabinose dehydrogenase